jgi:hypothetical protein
MQQRLFLIEVSVAGKVQSMNSTGIRACNRKIAHPAPPILQEKKDHGRKDISPDLAMLRYKKGIRDQPLLVSFHHPGPGKPKIVRLI